MIENVNKKPEDINILIGCEESQAVCIEFRKLGFNAFSCDLLPCSGGHPEWHLQQSVLGVLDYSFQAYNQFWTEAGTCERYLKWDMVIAFPPCTFLTVTGNRWFNEEVYKEKAVQRKINRLEAIKFFMEFANYNCNHIAIENPVGIMSSEYRKPNQIIQPYFFGDEFQKTTCLWLKNLPHLQHIKTPDLFNAETTHTGKGEMITYESGTVMSKWYADAFKLPKEERAKLRSKTFPGIAKAMATQWGEYLLSV